MATAALVTAAVGSIGAAVHGREVSRSSERQVRRDQKQANKIQQASSSVERARARRRAIAQQRISRAQNEAAATASGSAGSTAQLGADASTSSQLASNLSSANRSFVTGQATFDLRQSAANTAATGQRRANTINAVGGLFGQAGAVSAGFIPR